MGLQQQDNWREMKQALKAIAQEVDEEAALCRQAGLLAEPASSAPPRTVTISRMSCSSTISKSSIDSCGGSSSSWTLSHHFSDGDSTPRRPMRSPDTETTENLFTVLEWIDHKNDASTWVQRKIEQEQRVLIGVQAVMEQARAYGVARTDSGSSSNHVLETLFARKLAKFQAKEERCQRAIRGLIELVLDIDTSDAVVIDYKRRVREILEETAAPPVPPKQGSLSTTAAACQRQRRPRAGSGASGEDSAAVRSSVSLRSSAASTFTQGEKCEI